MTPSLIFLLGSYTSLTAHGLVIGGVDHLSTAGNSSSPPACIIGDGAIPGEYLCDGTIDCPDGSDETLAVCKDSPAVEFADDQYWMLHPPGYNAPSPEHYKTFYDLYKPRLADLPYVGKSAATVEVYLIDSPAFHDTRRYFGLKRWLLLQTTKFFDFLHFGVGFLYRDAKGRELGRIGVQYWTGYTEVLDNLNVLPDDNKMHFDKDGRLYFDTRAVATFRKSRGSWEGGYWDRALLLDTVDAQTYNKRLKWLNSWLPDHMQFLSFGYFDRNDNVLQPRTSCVEFARFFITAMTKVDIWKLDFEWVRVAMTGLEVDVLAKDLDSKELSNYLARNNLTLATNECKNCKESNVVVLAPAAYNADGSPDSQHDEYYSRVHILKPTGTFRLDHEPSSGRLMQNWRNSISFMLLGASVAFGVLCCTLKFFCSHREAKPVRRPSQSMIN